MDIISLTLQGARLLLVVAGRLGFIVLVWLCLDRLLVVRASTPALLLFDFQASLLEGLSKLFNHDGGLLEGS